MDYYLLAFAIGFWFFAAIMAVGSLLTIEAMPGFAIMCFVFCIVFMFTGTFIFSNA